MAYAELRGIVNLVGRANTLEILLEGRIFGADEALRIGLVNRIAADDAPRQKIHVLPDAGDRRQPSQSPAHSAWPISNTQQSPITLFFILVLRQRYS